MDKQCEPRTETFLPTPLLFSLLTMTLRKFHRSQSAYSPSLFSPSLCSLFCSPPPTVLGFLLFCPPSLCQQVPSINTELSIIGVTIGSCRYSVEGRQSVYRLQLLKCYQLPIHEHTHTQKHTHTHAWLYTHWSTKTHILYSLCIHITLDHRWCRKIWFGGNEIRSDGETKNHLLTIQSLVAHTHAHTHIIVLMKVLDTDWSHWHMAPPTGDL